MIQTGIVKSTGREKPEYGMNFQPIQESVLYIVCKDELSDKNKTLSFDKV